MSIFASYFWLWSIVGLLCLVLVYTLGAIMNLGGFVSPLKRTGRWIDGSPLPVKIGLVVLTVGLVGYPSLVHKLWADATANEVRHLYESLPAPPGARGAVPSEQMAGLYDPTGTEGTYVVGWYGTSATFLQVSAHYDRVLLERGWVQQPPPRGAPPSGSAGQTRVEYRDDPVPARSHYELVLAQLSPGSKDAPPEVADSPIVFAVRLGVVDPRRTNQVSWFIDCLVRRAPTFPSCEAMGWNPLEQHLDPAARTPAGPVRGAR